MSSQTSRLKFTIPAATDLGNVQTYYNANLDILDAELGAKLANPLPATPNYAGQIVNSIPAGTTYDVRQARSLMVGKDASTWVLGSNGMATGVSATGSGANLVSASGGYNSLNPPANSQTMFGPLNIFVPPKSIVELNWIANIIGDFGGSGSYGNDVSGQVYVKGIAGYGSYPALPTWNGAWNYSFQSTFAPQRTDRDMASYMPIKSYGSGLVNNTSNSAQYVTFGALCVPNDLTGQAQTSFYKPLGTTNDFAFSMVAQHVGWLT